MYEKEFVEQIIEGDAHWLVVGFDTTLPPIATVLVLGEVRFSGAADIQTSLVYFRKEMHAGPRWKNLDCEFCSCLNLSSNGAADNVRHHPPAALATEGPV
ncbi:MAG: hypothetical protein HY017_03555 [Betaproteobacteria bacterium]|nr:hypothetical protein [Betaproteobacteria bacterium]